MNAPRSVGPDYTGKHRRAGALGPAGLPGLPGPVSRARGVQAAAPGIRGHAGSGRHVGSGRGDPGALAGARPAARDGTGTVVRDGTVADAG